MDEVRNGWWLTTYASTVYSEHETKISTLDDEKLPPKVTVPYIRQQAYTCRVL